MSGPQLRRMGVVGAGGAGFPTSVKANSKVEYILANGAECEPLVHKDVHIMTRFAPQVIGGMRIMMELTGAKQGIIGIKAKNKTAVQAIEAQIADSSDIKITILGDFYPAGDEYELVNLATGRLIPPGGLPVAVGCVVNNVETLFNVYQASLGAPVTGKFVSIVGLVNNPSCFYVPIGTSLKEVLEWAGGPSRSEVSYFLNGLMMGRMIDNLDIPITKTTGALIVLPKDHRLAQRANRTLEEKLRVNRVACDQCSHCTELCPRHLLGYQVEPHKVMRGIGLQGSSEPLLNNYAALCVACGLCTMYSCPEGLYPREACNKAKADLRSAGQKFTQEKAPQVSAMKESRRVPTASLRKRLGVENFDTETEYRDIPQQPKRVKILMSQHIGKPAIPVVMEGSHVIVGDTIATLPDDQLGVDIHSSIDGVVKFVSESYIEVEGK